MHKYALLLLLFSSVYSMSQNCYNTLSGTVTDLHDGSLLVDATLIVAGTEQTVQTNSKGKFIISNLCNKTYSIQVHHQFCETKGYTIAVSGNTVKNFKLEHHIDELNEITIKGKAYTKKSHTVLENTISSNDLEQFSGGTIGDALNSLSGVSSLNTGNNVVKPIVNGLHSSRITIINNGVRMEDQEWGVEHAPNIDINSVSNLTLVKGASALQYSGDAVGGVIIAETAKVPVKDSIYGKTFLTMATNGRGSSMTSKLTKSFKTGWYTSAQGTLKYLGDFEAPNYVLSNTGVSERSVALNLGYNRFDYGIDAYYSFFDNTVGILRASHLGGAEDQDRALSSSKPLVINDFTYKINNPKQEVSHRLARLQAFKRFNKLGKLSFQYDFQYNNRFEYDIRRGDRKNKPSVDLELKTYTLKLDLESSLTDATNLKTGVVCRYQDNYADPSTGVRRLIPDYESYDLGVYGIADYRLNDNWFFEAGARYDYTYMDVYKFYRKSLWEERNYDKLFPEIVIKKTASSQVLARPQLDFNNTSATLGTIYTFNKDFQLFFNYALASRIPNPSELFSEGLHHSASRIEIGDLRFKSEIGHKVILALQKQGEQFSFSVSPYINNISNFLVIEPVEVRQTIRGNFQVWEYRQTSAQLLGVDVDASFNFNENMSYNHQFSLVKGYDNIRNTPLISMPPVNTKNSITYKNSALHNLKLELQNEYVFKQNEYPNTNFEIYLPSSETYKTIDVSTPPNAYSIFNFNSSIALNIKNNSTLTIGLGITNVLNTSYRNYLNRMRFYADDLGRNYLINLKLNY